VPKSKAVVDAFFENVTFRGSTGVQSKCADGHPHFFGSSTKCCSSDLHYLHRERLNCTVPVVLVPVVFLKDTGDTHGCYYLPMLFVDERGVMMCPLK